MTDTNTAERASFEAWYISKTRDILPSSGDGWSDDQIRDSFMGLSGNAQYRSSSAQLSWDAWQARASLAASAGSEPVAWRYVPSKVWGDKVFTDDPVRAEDARQAGCIVEPLYTHPSTPEGMAGWKWVPIEPTVDQEWEGKEASRRVDSMAEACKIYKAMIAAAPPLPASEAKEL